MERGIKKKALGPTTQSSKTHSSCSFKAMFQIRKELSRCRQKSHSGIHKSTKNSPGGIRESTKNSPQHLMRSLIPSSIVLFPLFPVSLCFSFCFYFLFSPNFFFFLFVMRLSRGFCYEPFLWKRLGYCWRLLEVEGREMEGEEGFRRLFLRDPLRFCRLDGVVIRVRVEVLLGCSQGALKEVTASVCRVLEDCFCEGDGEWRLWRVLHWGFLRKLWGWFFISVGWHLAWHHHLCHLHDI